MLSTRVEEVDGGILILDDVAPRILAMSLAPGRLLKARTKLEHCNVYTKQAIKTISEVGERKPCRGCSAATPRRSVSAAMTFQNQENKKIAEAMQKGQY